MKIGIIKSYLNNINLFSYTALVKLIQEQQFDITDIENLKIGADFSTYEIDKLSVLPLLYQTGYLTIKSYDAEGGYYKLGLS